MLEFLIKLIIDAICAVLNALGGDHWLFCRRFIMVSVIAVAFSYFSHTWWLGALVLPAMGIECLGYFSGQNWGRGLWLFVQSIALNLGAMLLGHLYWQAFIPIVVLAGIYGCIYKNWKQWYGDLGAGFILSLGVWFVH